MDAAMRRALATSLKKGRYKWSMRLPAEAGTFYGKRIGVEITPLLWGKKGEPPLAPREMKLLGQILGHLPRLIRKSEKEWWAYHGDPDYAQSVSRPQIWISREDQAGRDPGKWSFVVELRESSYAWHLEFKGLRFQEIWAGS